MAEGLESECLHAMSLADPLPELVDNICARLFFDGEALLRLGAVNKFWRGIAHDPEVWQRFVEARFGPDARAATTPAQPATAIPGWCFFPGLDSDGSDCASPEDARGQLQPASLAARAKQLGAVAFNTNGWIKRSLKPFSRWTRNSYVPGVGLYVREEEVANRLGRPLPPPLPQKAEPEARPPDFPGWVFYPMMDSTGCDIRHPESGAADFRSSCSTLGDLAEVASRLRHCVAFNTAGYLKHNLYQQVHWRRMSGSCGWEGMYVREDVATARRLWRPAQGRLMDPCISYFQLAKTRLLAARDIDVTWLDGQHLVRVPDPSEAAGGAGAGPAAAAESAEGPAAVLPLPPAEVVSLANVCWLELGGHFNGVGPGRYRCVWLLRASRNCSVSELNSRITLRAARRLGGGAVSSGDADGVAAVEQTATAAPATSEAPAAAVSPSGGAGAAEGGGDAPAVGSELGGLLVGRKELSSRSGPGWCRQRAGTFEVPCGAVYDITVRLWNHSGSWKSGLTFKELRLERMQANDVEEVEAGQGAEGASSAAVEGADDEDYGDDDDDDGGASSFGPDEWLGEDGAEWHDGIMDYYDDLTDDDDDAGGH